MARRLRQTHVAGDDGLEDEVAQAGADIVGNLVGQAIAPVVHGERDAEDRQVRIEAAANPVDRLEQLRQALERKKLALERHKNLLHRDHGIDGQQAERRRAIDQAYVPTAFRRMAERIDEAMGALLEVDELDLGARQILGRGDQVEPGHVRCE